MAYSMFSRPKLNSSKNIRYYPEYEFPLDPNYHCHSFNCHQDNEISVHSIPKEPKRTVSMRPKTTVQKKCPIYVHPIDKDSNTHQNAYAYDKIDKYLNDIRIMQEEPNINNIKSITNNRPKKADKNKKAVLSKIEESYWANWKPNKPSKDSNLLLDLTECVAPKSTTKPSKKFKTKPKIQHSDYGEQMDTMVKRYNEKKTHVIKPFFSEKYTESRSSQSFAERFETVVQKSVESHQIQTDYSVRDAETLSRIDEEILIENVSSGMINQIIQSLEKASINDDESNEDKQEDINMLEGLSEEKVTQIIEADQESILDKVPVKEDTLAAIEDQITDENKEEDNKETVEETNEETKSLKHTDSLILTKMKQNEDKPHYQQPKCIRLYKKTGIITTSSFTRGGSYPLKSCLKRGPMCSIKKNTNIRLGKPGSPLIVTSNCLSSRSSNK